MLGCLSLRFAGHYIFLSIFAKTQTFPELSTDLAKVGSPPLYHYLKEKKAKYTELWVWFWSSAKSAFIIKR